MTIMLSGQPLQDLGLEKRWQGSLFRLRPSQESGLEPQRYTVFLVAARAL